MYLNLNKDEWEIIYDFIDIYFFQMIRDDVEMDNIEYVKKMIHIHDAIKEALKQD